MIVNRGDLPGAFAGNFSFDPSNNTESIILKKPGFLVKLFFREKSLRRPRRAILVSVFPQMILRRFKPLFYFLGTYLPKINYKSATALPVAAIQLLQRVTNCPKARRKGAKLSRAAVQARFGACE